MKRTNRCVKCGSASVGHLSAQIDSDSGAAPRAVGIAEGRTDWLGAAILVGKLEAFVCTSCGYFESYVKDPESVEWSEIAGLRMLEPGAPSDGPFR